MTQPTRAELMRRLADAENEREACVAGLIYLELGELLAGVESSEDQAAAALRDACKALEEPRARLDALDQAVTDAEGRCVEWSHQLADDDPDTRAARMHYQEWSAEVGNRRARREDAERGYRDLFGDRERCRRQLEVLQTAKQAVLYAQLNPFGSDLAKGTGAYVSLRMPMLGELLLRHDTGHPEWDQAIDQLRGWCLRSGYRTDDLPSEAEQVARALTMATADPGDAVADPVPNMIDLMAMEKAAVTNAALQDSPARIDDYRNPRTAVPRNARVPDYKAVLTLREMLG